MLRGTVPDIPALPKNSATAKKGGLREFLHAPTESMCSSKYSIVGLLPLGKYPVGFEGFLRLFEMNPVFPSWLGESRMA
jgi:hypothetical protein